MSPLPASEADFVNHRPGIECLKSGTWIAKIQHPISKVWVLLGTYTTPAEAEDTYARKKLEYESCSVHKSTPSPFHTSVKYYENCPGIRHDHGKWQARILHNSERISLGYYTTPKEAAEAYILSKLELDSKSGAYLLSQLELNSTKPGRLRRKSGSVYQVSKGEWKAEIQRNKVKYSLGTYATAEDAQEAIDTKRGELDWNAGTKKTGFSQQTERGNPITKTRAHSGILDFAHEADEAYNNMTCEFDETVHAHKKCRCDDHAKAQGKNDSACVSDELSEHTDISSGIGAYNSMMREFDKTVHAHKKSRCEDDAKPQSKSDSACVSDELFDHTDRSSGIEPYNNMMREFDITAHAHEKRRCEDDAIAQGKSGSACVSDELFVHNDISSGIEAYNNMMREFDKTVHAHKKSRCKGDAIAQGRSGSACVSDELFEHTDRCSGIEPYNNMMHEFDITVHAHEKSRCEDDAVAQGKTGSACVSDELIVPADGSSGIEAVEEEEAGDSMINVNVESVPVVVTEVKREFDSGILDCYGLLVGEYSSLDDDLWLC